MEIFELTYDDFEKWRKKIIPLLQVSIETNFPHSVAQSEYYSEKCDELKNYLYEDKATVFCAQDKEKLVGIIWTCRIQRFNELRLHVVNFAVMPGWQRLGIGNELLLKTEEYAVAHSISAMDLIVTAGNENAVGFYMNRDFWTERYLMKKDLKHADRKDGNKERPE